MTGITDVDAANQRTTIPVWAFVLVGVFAGLALLGSILGYQAGLRAGTEQGFSAGSKAGAEAGQKAGYDQGYTKGNDEGFKKAMDLQTSLGESYQANMIYNGFPMDDGRWFLHKVEKTTPKPGFANMYSWEVVKSFDMESGTFELRGDSVFTIGRY